MVLNQSPTTTTTAHTTGLIGPYVCLCASRTYELQLRGKVNPVQVYRAKSMKAAFGSDEGH